MVAAACALSLHARGTLLALIPARPVGGGSVHLSVLAVTSGLPYFGQIFLLEFSIFTLLCGCSNGKGTNMEKVFAVCRAMLDMKLQLPGPALFLLGAFSSWSCLALFFLFLHCFFLSQSQVPILLFCLCLSTQPPKCLCCWQNPTGVLSITEISFRISGKANRAVLGSF